MSKLVVKTPSLLDTQNLLLALEPYYFIDWTPEEIAKGYKTHYGQKVYIEKTMMDYAVISSYVLPIDDKNYLTFDLSYRIVWLPAEYSFETNEYSKLVDFISRKGKFLNEANLYNSNYRYYLGIYIKLCREKVFKNI